VDGVKTLAFYSSLILVVLLSIIGSRISQEPDCVRHTSIIQLSLFSKGILKTVPTCSLSNVFLKSNWESEEKEVIHAVHSLGKLESGIILTIDLVNKKKLNSILNYNWIGANYLKHIQPLSHWLETKSYSTYQGKEESAVTLRILNQISFNLSQKNTSYFNWKTYELNSWLHLKDILLTADEFCSHFLLNLDFNEFCNLKRVQNDKIMPAAIELFLADLVSSYLIKMPVLDRLRTIQDLKQKRGQFQLQIDLGYINKITSYSSLVLKINQEAIKIIKAIQPNKFLNSKWIAEVTNEKTLFKTKDLLVVFPKKAVLGSFPNNLETTNTTRILVVNENAQIYSPRGILLKIHLGDVYFMNQIQLTDSLSLKSKAVGHSKFVYLIDRPIDLKELKKMGIESYLKSKKEIGFAKFHPASLSIANIFNVKLIDIESLGEKLGWLNIKKVLPENFLIPSGKIDGVINFRK
jgi:hypothetical protein